MGRADDRTHSHRPWPFVVLPRAVADEQGSLGLDAHRFERRPIHLGRGLAPPEPAREHRRVHQRGDSVLLDLPQHHLRRKRCVRAHGQLDAALPQPPEHGRRVRVDLRHVIPHLLLRVEDLVQQRSRQLHTRARPRTRVHVDVAHLVLVRAFDHGLERQEHVLHDLLRLRRGHANRLRDGGPETLDDLQQTPFRILERDQSAAVVEQHGFDARHPHILSACPGERPPS